MMNMNVTGRKSEKKQIFVKLCDPILDHIELITHIPITLEPIMSEKRIRFKVIAQGIGPVGYLPHGFPSKYIDKIYNESPTMVICDIDRSKDGTILYFDISIMFA